MEWIRRKIIAWLNYPIQTNTKVENYIIKNCVFNRYWYQDQYINIKKQEKIKIFANMIKDGKWEAAGEIEGNENEPEKAIYVCPKCDEWGIPSIYGDCCTNCANIERGFKGVQKIF